MLGLYVPGPGLSRVFLVSYPIAELKSSFILKEVLTPSTALFGSVYVPGAGEQSPVVARLLRFPAPNDQDGYLSLTAAKSGL